MKRMIAAILVLCMVLCSIPVAAAASFDEFFADVPATVENDASYPFAESDDETCLISGNKGVGRTTSALKLTFRSGGTFRFSYKVSSESNYDYMAVTKNGTNLTQSSKASYSGAMTSFQTYTMEVAANDVVTIGYSKDYGGDQNDDTLYLKDFSCKTYYGVTFTGAPAGTAFTLTDSADASYAVTDGKASVPAGEYRYTAEAFGYAQATGSFTVTDAAVEVPVTMTELARHKAAFSITGLAAGTTAAVTVKHGDEVMQAEEDGSYLLFPADYSYQVKAAGYKTARGTFTLGEADTTVKVTMVPGIEWDGTVADGFAGGTGTQADPYLISNGEELGYLSAQVASGNAFAGKYVTLAANLDMGNVAFTPIGSDARRFAGSFDGAYHTIDNLLVSQTTDYAGLFGCLDTGAAVRRLTVRGSISGRGYVGGIAGQADSATIEACANYATVTGTSRNVGGIVGRLNGKSAARSTVLRCANFGTISNGTNNFSAGIVGTAYYTTLSECYNVGSATGNRVGGILGQTDSNTTVTSCYNAGAITLAAAGNHNYAVSLIGYNDGGSVSNCYYLTGMQAIGRGSGDTTALTEEQLKSLDTVLKLGGAFVNDAKNQNSGYPVLAWQDADAKLIVAFSVNMTGASVHVYDAQNVEQTPEEDGTYRLVSGSYTYLVTRDECDDVTGSFTIDGAGRTITVTLSVRTYPVSVALTPAEAKLVLRDADGKQWSAVNGAWRLPKGSYTYEASLFGYETASGSLTVTGENDSLHVTLQQAARHSVRIATVKADDGSALSGADISVTHAEGGEQTAVNGVYSLPDGTYSYAVMLDGYLNVAGSFTVAGKDLTVTVRLEEGSNVWTGKASDTAPETKSENGVTWYLIKTPEELAWFAAKVNGGETTINARIMVNLVLNSTEAPKANRWGGFGKYNLQYSGIFDGNGKTISGYYSCDNDDTYESAMGLCGYLGADGVIKNVTLVGMIEGDGAIGAFANQSYGRIEGCVSRVNITNAASYGGVTGGIAARVYASGAIVNCGNEGSVTCTLSSAYSDAKVGGIVGASYAPITGCYNTGAINGGSNNRGYVGGIVGYTENGSVQILNCYNTGSVTGATCVGGIAGKHTGGTDPTVTNCYNTGSVKGASCGALDYPMDVAQTTGIAADGKITYFNADPATLGLAAHFARVSGVELTLTRGESSADITAMVILNWDLDTVRDYLEKAAASVTFDTIRNQNTSEAEIISDLQLPQRTGAYPFVTFAWTSDSKLISIEGSTAGEVLTGRVTRPSVDTKVHLYPTLTFQLNEGTMQTEGFRLTLPAEDLEPLRQQMQKELDENYLVTKLTYVVTGEVIDPEAVNGDIQLLTARATGIENYDDYKFIVTSDDPDVAEINAYRANIYRPMPGEAAAEVTLTVTMQHKTKDVSVQKQITLKVLPLTKAELDDALNLMEQAKAHYWDGLNDGANESQYAVTKSLHAFREAVAGENGGLTWLYDYRDAHGAGIVAGDQADYSSVGGQEQYNKFKSSNPAVIAHENLVLTQPKYNTSVTVESVLEHAVFAKYAKKITSGAWYDDYFSKLTGQKVSATMTVLGTDGPNPGGDQPPVKTTVTVVLTGVNGVGAVDRTFDTTSDKTVAEALQEGLGEDYTLTVSGYGYIGSLTGPDDFNAANAGVEFWGQYYYIDGAYDTSSPLTVPVTDGAVYGIFANEKNTTGENYGYKYNVWIHERSVTAEAETAFDVTVCQMQGNTAVPQAGVKVYADGNVMGVSDENGKVICRFEHAGDYVLTTGDELHTYSQCRVHVTEKPFKATVTVRLTGVNGIGAIDRTLEVSSSSTVAEALQQGFGEDYVLTVSEYGYIGSLTGPEDFNAANAAVAYWGQYYFVNGAYDTSSPLTVPVTAGGIYGVFANESTADSDSYYGYKYNVWFHETALTAAASETFTATVYQMGTGVAPAEGVQIFCGGELLGRTAADGTFAWHFDTAGVYVLTTGDSNHTYSQCVVTVTGKAPVCDGGANCPSRAFPDLDPAQWYHLSTDYAITNHLFIGFEDGTFRPNGQMSRAMFAMVLWRVAGSPASSAALPFADVAADAWYADAVRWAYAAGVINGVSTTAFDPESPVTREQMVTMIVRYAEKIGAVTGARDDLSQFSDGMQVSSYALAAVRWAVAVGLLRGMGNGRLEPQGTATRAEVATLLMRFASLGK